MRIAVAAGARTRHLIREQFFCKRTVLTHVLKTFQLPGVALHAVGVGVGLLHPYFAVELLERHILEAVQIVLIHVVETAEFGERVAQHSVVAVADVTGLSSREVIARVTRGERSAFWVHGIFKMRRHHVAAAAKFAFRGAMQAVARRGRNGRQGKHAQGKQQSQSDLRRQGWSND